MRMLQPSLDRCRREQWKVRLGFVIIEFSRRVGWAYLSLKSMFAYTYIASCVLFWPLSIVLEVLYDGWERLC